MWSKLFRKQVLFCGFNPRIRGSDSIVIEFLTRFYPYFAIEISKRANGIGLNPLATEKFAVFNSAILNFTGVRAAGISFIPLSPSSDLKTL